MGSCVSTQGIKDKKSGSSAQQPKPQKGEAADSSKIEKTVDAQPAEVAVAVEEPVVEEEAQADLGDLEWYTKFLPEHSKKLDILHFNDAYNIEEKASTSQSDDQEPVGGVARFKKAFDLYRSAEKLVLFSGDLFFPSTLSTHFNGEQMVEPFNKLNVDVSCLGSHDIEMGIELGAQLINKTNCPWVLSNIIEKDKEDKPLCGVEPYKVIDHQGFKIGVMGFAEEAQLEQFKPEVDVSQLEYLDFSEQQAKYSQILKEEHKCDLIVALNHMRVPDDIKMARDSEINTLDMIFGGHDHTYFRELSDDTDVFIQKSGTDFEDFSNVIALFDVKEEDYEAYAEQLQVEAQNSMYDMSLIEVFYSAQHKRMYISERIPITKKFSPDFDMAKHVSQYMKDMQGKIDGWAGSTGPVLEARFSRLTTTETNLGNMIADLVRTQFGTDIGLLNAGGLQANQEIAHGPFTWKMVNQLLPQQDNVFKIKIKGALLKQVLENSVSAWPKYDGRWPLLSGLKFSFDPQREPGERILPESMMVQQSDGGKPLDFDRVYSVAINSEMASGRNGFDVLLDSSVQRCNYTVEDEIDIREIVTYFLKTFQRNEQQEMASPAPSRKMMKERMELLKSKFSEVCPVTGFLFLFPAVEERIVNIGEPIVYDD